MWPPRGCAAWRRFCSASSRHPRTGHLTSPFRLPFSAMCFSRITFSSPECLCETLVTQIGYHLSDSLLRSLTAFLFFLFNFMGHCLNFIFYSFKGICYLSSLKMFSIFLFMVFCLWVHRCSSFPVSLMILVMCILKIFTILSFSV